MCKYCNLLRSDRPFKIHRTNSNTGKILIGKLAENYLSDFENRIYNMAMINSIMTCVIGHPGVGKTQMLHYICLLYTSPSPRDISGSRMPSSA